MRKIARTIAAMLAAEAVFTEGRQAVIDRASTVIDADTLDEPVVRFARRRLLRRRAAPANANLPDTRADAIRFAAAFVAANHAVLDAVASTDSSAPLNESLRSMLGHGVEDWVSERVKPWRNMVIRRGLAWP
ncbi:MAG: hypothetical protein EBY61_04580 [Actinobacteria bacterium]|nr:hypothetical protein [Actinomycetota bacterium]